MTRDMAQRGEANIDKLAISIRRLDLISIECANTIVTNSQLWRMTNEVLEEDGEL